MTQACGLLELAEPRDAFLASLCSFTLADAAADGAEPHLVAPGRGLEPVTSPTGAPP